jgi:hypothetical protein
MKRERLYRIHIHELGNVTVDYYLTIDEEDCYDKFGVCLVKTTAGDLVEEFASIDHVWHDRRDATLWIKRLAMGKAMPISLADIIDDSLN